LGGEWAGGDAFFKIYDYVLFFLDERGLSLSWAGRAGCEEVRGRGRASSPPLVRPAPVLAQKALSFIHRTPNVIRIVVNFAEGWDLSFEVQSAGASVGVHGDGSLGWANVPNKVWVADSPVNAGARV